MRLRSMTLGAVAFAGWAGSAAAQQMPTMPAVEPKRSFEVSGAVQAVYDSNLARASRAIAATRRITPEDYMLLPSVNVAGVQPLGQQALFLNASAGYDFHKENKKLDRGRFSLQGGGDGRAGPCQVQGYVDYRGAQSDLQDDTLTVSTNFQQTLGEAARISCSRNTGIGATLSANREHATNSATQSKPSNHFNRSLQAGLTYGNASLGTLSANYTFSNARFPMRQNPGRPLGDGFETTTYSLGAEHDFGRRLKLNLQGGMTHFKREFAPPGVPQKFNSRTYSATGSYRLGERIHIDASADRAVNPSSRPGKLYDIETGYSGVVTYNLGTRFTVSLGESYQKSNSNVDTSIATPVVTRSRNYATTGTFLYRQSARASLALNVRQEDRKTNLPAFDYSDTRVSLTAQVRY
jgi:hypothetical protein